MPAAPDPNAPSSRASRSTFRVAFSLTLCCLLAAPACKPKPRPPSRRSLPASVCEGQGGAATAAWLVANAPLAHTARARARAWLDKITLDLRDLDQHDIPGKRKLAELLGIYVELYDTAGAADRTAILTRVRAIATVTAEPQYHDLDKVDDAIFKRDSTSYLRVAFLMGHAGLDTTAYRKHIEVLRERLDRQMSTRGYNQQMIFHAYYRYFGLKEPYPLVEAKTVGVIPGRKSPYKLTQSEVYDLAHEVGARYDLEELAPDAAFLPADLAYLRWALDRLTVRYLMADNRDLAGELAISMAYLGFTDLAVFREAIDFLLQSQNPDGSWGAYQEARATYGTRLDVAMYLRTTVIATRALILTFAKL